MKINLFSSLEDLNLESFNYPAMYGMLTAEVRSYLRGDATREHLTAMFAQLDMFHSVYAEAFSTGLSPEKAIKRARAAFSAVQSIEKGNKIVVDQT